MTSVVIIKSVSGMYHLCHWDTKTDKHYSIQEFVSFDLAEAMACKMNGDMMRPPFIEASHG